MTEVNPVPELRVSALALMAIISERPMTGYELKKLIDSSEMIFWRDSFGSIYPNLSHLTRLGLTTKTPSRKAGRKRITYELTPSGRQHVEDWLKLPAEQRPVKIELLLKLRFGYPLGKDALEKLLKAHLDHHKGLLPELFEGLEHIDGLEPSLQLETRRMTLDFWYRYTRMMIEWSMSCLERLDGQPLR